MDSTTIASILVDRVGHERANAEGEGGDPSQPIMGRCINLVYMTGAFQFYALKKELVDSGKMTLQTISRCRDAMKTVCLLGIGALSSLSIKN